MAHEEDALEHERASWKPGSGLAVAVPDPVQNPELPPHRQRVTDKDPAAMRRAVRTVYTLFYLSVAFSIWASIAYMIFPIESGEIIDIRNNNLFVGLGIAFALLAIGIGAIHWSKAVMSDKEFIEPRHATRGRDATREGAVQVFRPISNNDLIVGAVGVLQFDVVVARLKSEYNVEAVYESVNVATARWVECADAKKFEEFKRKNESQLALDGGDNLAYIATSMVNLRLAQERYPDVQFHQTREH